MGFLAIRHLLSRKRQTILTLLGITLGTAAFIAISGMMIGFQNFIIDQLVNNDSHVRISAREDVLTPHSLDSAFFGDTAIVSWISPPSGRRDNAYILYPRMWFDIFENDPDVAGASPQLVVQAIATRGKGTSAVRLIGADPNKQVYVTNIEKYMLQGRFGDIGNGGNRIIVGDGLLNKLGAAVPETLNLSVGKGLSQPFRIVGSFRLGIKTLDDTTIFGALTDIQKLNGTPSRVSDIAVRLFDVSKAGDVASNWNIRSPEKVQSWDQANEGIMSVFTTQNIVRNSMTVSILIVAAFGIYNILSMTVNQKRREIAILRSMGYLPKDILLLFFIQGVILGAVGGIVGCILGNGICHLMATIKVSSQRGLGSDHMFISFLPSIYVKGFLLAFMSSTLASIFPARAAGKMSPIEIIRGDNS